MWTVAASVLRPPPLRAVVRVPVPAASRSFRFASARSVCRLHASTASPAPSSVSAVSISVLNGSISRAPLFSAFSSVPLSSLLALALAAVAASYGWS